jgi:hypothetical protein
MIRTLTILFAVALLAIGCKKDSDYRAVNSRKDYFILEITNVGGGPVTDTIYFCDNIYDVK